MTSSYEKNKDYRSTVGSDMEKIEKRLNDIAQAIGYLSQVLEVAISNYERRKEFEHSRSSHGLYDPQEYRRSYDEFSGRYANPVPRYEPYDPKQDPSRVVITDESMASGFKEGSEEAKEENN
jgi:hypothetical protein